MIPPDPRPASTPARTRTALIALLASLTLAACSQPNESGTNAAGAQRDAPASATTAADDQGSEAAPTPAEPTPPASPADDQGETIGGDGSPIRLTPLSMSDIDDADLSGELVCTFGTADSPPLLYAAGDVGSSDPAMGVVKVLDSVERIGAPGGYNGMVRGATFAGQGKTVRIALTGGPIGGGESPPHSATLTYERADGASRTFNGLWTCGP
jgi:ABC-type amino acid transport substrate-binding protein